MVPPVGQVAVVKVATDAAMATGVAGALAREEVAKAKAVAGRVRGGTVMAKEEEELERVAAAREQVAKVTEAGVTARVALELVTAAVEMEGGKAMVEAAKEAVAMVTVEWGRLREVAAAGVMVAEERATVAEAAMAEVVKVVVVVARVVVETVTAEKARAAVEVAMEVVAVAWEKVEEDVAKAGEEEDKAKEVASAAMGMVAVGMVT